MKKKRARSRGPGRPPTSERTQITKTEQEYAKLRAKGFSVQQACKALNLVEREWENRERNFPLLRREIERYRQEEMAIDADETLCLIHKNATDLRRLIMDALTGRKDMSVADMERAYGLLHSIDVKLQDLEEKEKRFQASMKESRPETDMQALLDTISDGLRHTPLHCSVVFKKLPKEEQEEFLDETLLKVYDIDLLGVALMAKRELIKKWAQDCTQQISYTSTKERRKCFPRAVNIDRNQN